ncbi:hypothetical protein [Streptomyces sp. NPDC002666]
MSARLFVPDPGGADHGGTARGEGVGERLASGAVLESVEEDESQVRQADALFEAALAERGGGVPQQGLGEGEGSGVTALLEQQRQPDGGVVREAGLGRRAFRFAGQGGEERAQPVRHLRRVLLVHRDEPQQRGTERPRIALVPREVAEQVGVAEGQGPAAPHASVGQGGSPAYLVGRLQGLRPEEPFQGALLGVRALGLLEDAAGGVLGAHAASRPRTAVAGAVSTVRPCCVIAPPSAGNRINLPMAEAT